MGIKNIFYTGMFLGGTAIATLLNSCASSPKSTGQEILNELKQRDTIVMQEKQIKKGKKQSYKEDSLDKLVNVSLNYRTRSKSKILYGKTGEIVGPFYYNPLIELTKDEGKGVQSVVDTITTSTYNEFITNLSKLNEKQITITLSTLGRIMEDYIYKKGTNQNIDSEEMYCILKRWLKGNYPPVDEVVRCGQIHNFLSETARKAGLPEAITFSCDTKDIKHVASALWWSDGSIKIIDYEDIYAGNSDLELILKEYQKIQGVPAFSHNIYRKENHIFTFTTADGKIFYNAVNHLDNTLQLKQILTEQERKKTNLEVRAGNNENSVRYSEKSLFGKIGALKGPENTWNGNFFQAGLENSIKDNMGFYNINLLVTNIEDFSMFGICGNITYGKKIKLNSFDKLFIAGQLAALTDFKGGMEQNTLTNEKDWLSFGTGIDYTHKLDKNIKSDIYTLIRIEPVCNSVLTDKIKAEISEIRAGLKLTSGDISINPEYTFDNKSDTFSLETAWNNNNLDVGFKLSTSDTRYKYIWSDENSLKLSTIYTITNDFRIGSSVEYSKKKWPSDESHNSEVKFWLESRF